MAATSLPIVILTRRGYDDIVPRVTPRGAVFYLNPGLARPEEIAALEHAGASVQLLAASIDAAQAPSLPALSGQPALWIERGVPVAAAPVPPAAPAPASAPAAALEAGEAPLHRRLARSAGVFAGRALRRLAAPEGRQLMLLPYLGFGNGVQLWLKGRVLDEHSFREQTSQDSGWDNLVALYRRLESDEVAGARVRARFGERTWETETDAGGYFSFDIALDTPLSGGWHGVDLELPGGAGPRATPVHARAEVLVPAPSARFGIISDIDDTVLWTNVTNKLNMAWMLARSNHHTRKPFKGVAAFYRALRDGAGGAEDNPLFYVSSSPWHLYGPLLDFLRLQDIPVGPLLLRELRVRDVFKLTEHGNHKLEKIERILACYPGMQFVLVGDSGEQDPEIYTEVVRRHPQAVRMIYIRNVNPDPSRIEALDRLIDEVSATGTQLVLAPDSVFAASHAAAAGLIKVERLSDIRADKKDDDPLLAT